MGTGPYILYFEMFEDENVRKQYFVFKYMYVCVCVYNIGSSTFCMFRCFNDSERREREASSYNILLYEVVVGIAFCTTPSPLLFKFLDGMSWVWNDTYELYIPNV